MSTYVLPLFAVRPRRKPRVVSWGLGCDSSSLLARILTESSARDFDLDVLKIVTCQVGSEWRSTIEAASLLLPLIRDSGAEYLQLARGGPSARDRYVVLDRSKRPERLYSEGHYRLLDELESVGSVPTWRPGTRACSAKNKGDVADGWLRDEFGEERFEHHLGFNADEAHRVEKDRSFGRLERDWRFPLVEWGWGREAVEAHLRRLFGREFKRSACVFCPYSQGSPAAMRRYREEPEAAVIALRLETAAVALLNTV